VADLLRHSRALCAAKRRAAVRRNNELEQTRKQAYVRGRSDRDREFTQVIGAGCENEVWLTERPTRDTIEVRPPPRIPGSALTADLRFYGHVCCRSILFRARVWAECFDGIEYRQAIWERVR
jgi:hypothetical protein